MNYEIEGIKLLKRDGLMNYLTPTAGCYAITLDDNIVYVGQSKRVLYRCGEHYFHCLNAWSHSGSGTNYKYTLLEKAIKENYKIGFYQISTEQADEEQLIEDCGLPLMNIRVKGKNRNDIYDIVSIEELIKTTTKSVNKENIKQMIDIIDIPMWLQEKVEEDLEEESVEPTAANDDSSSLLEWDKIKEFKATTLKLGLQSLEDEIKKIKQEKVELQMDLDDIRREIEYLKRGIDEGWFD